MASRRSVWLPCSLQFAGSQILLIRPDTRSSTAAQSIGDNSQSGVGYSGKPQSLTCVLLEIDPPDDNDAEWYAQAQGLLNATTFAATLLARADFDTGMQFHASNAMVEGVERPYDETREVQYEWRVYLPPAAIWILGAGEKLHSLCFEDVAGGIVNPPSPRWPGRGFQPERWGVWKQRFADLASDVEIDERCRGFAARAAEKMGMLERI